MAVQNLEHALNNVAYGPRDTTPQYDILVDRFLPFVCTVAFHINVALSLSLSLSVRVTVTVCVYVCVTVYVYLYISISVFVRLQLIRRIRLDTSPSEMSLKRINGQSVPLAMSSHAATPRWPQSQRAVTVQLWRQVHHVRLMTWRNILFTGSGSRQQKKCVEVSEAGWWDEPCNMSPPTRLTALRQR